MKKVSCLLLLIMICLSVFANKLRMQSYAYDEYAPVNAKSMAVVEGNSNMVLYSYNKDDRLPMASTTKILTAILAIEMCDNLDEKFIVSDKAVGIEGTSIYLNTGEEISMRELLYGLILASGNDCAVAIAERLGGLDLFVEKMNQFVIELGLNNTHLDNPHGLDSMNHYTSAYDLAIITSYALKNDEFKNLVSTERMVIDPTNVYQARYLKHKNRLLFTDKYCIGVKTGFTDNAGRCLVHAHEENGLQIITVVLNCPSMFEECDRLTKLAIDNYMMKEFIKPYNFVSQIEVLDSKKSEIGIITVKGFKYPIKK